MFRSRPSHTAENSNYAEERRVLYIGTSCLSKDRLNHSTQILMRQKDYAIEHEKRRNAYRMHLLQLPLVDDQDEFLLLLSRRHKKSAQDV